MGSFQYNLHLLMYWSFMNGRDGMHVEKGAAGPVLCLTSASGPEEGNSEERSLEQRRGEGAPGTPEQCS